MPHDIFAGNSDAQRDNRRAEGELLTTSHVEGVLVDGFGMGCCVWSADAYGCRRVDAGGENTRVVGEEERSKESRKRAGSRVFMSGRGGVGSQNRRQVRLAETGRGGRQQQQQE